MGELTAGTPKPLLEVNGKTLLEYKFEALPYDINEIIIIVGYMGGKIHDRFGGSYKDKSILYIEQEKLDGTAGALWLAKPLLKEEFLVMMGDDMYSKAEIDRCIAIQGWTMLVQETEHMDAGGCVITDTHDKILSIEEGSHHGKAGLVGTNLFSLDMRLFDYPLVAKAEGSDEYGLPQTVVAASVSGKIPFTAVKATEWIQITSPEDLEKATHFLKYR